MNSNPTSFDNIIQNTDLETIENSMQKIVLFQKMIVSQLKKDHDYGVIPGTKKATLYKPGAEKIVTLLGIFPDYEILEKVTEYKENLFAYTIKCKLFHGQQQAGEGLGHCNSWETKYKYENVTEESLPNNIDKSLLQTKKNDYGRTTYRIEKDACTIANTILKMAKKRAFIDAVVTIASLSDIFQNENEQLKKEAIAEMTVNEAANLVVNRGKHVGKTMREIWKKDYSYIKYMKENFKDAIILRAIDILELESVKAAALKNAKQKLEDEQNKTA